jgi:hypothetical protein
LLHAREDDGKEPARADGTALGRVSRRVRRRRSIRVARATRDERERALSRALELEQNVIRPLTREHCAEGPRPCPFVACRHHLYLDVAPETGTIKLNFPDLEVWELADSCALDIAEAGGLELERTGALLNVTRERIRQIEAVALAKLSAVNDVRTLRDT